MLRSTRVPDEFLGRGGRAGSLGLAGLVRSGPLSWVFEPRCVREEIDQHLLAVGLAKHQESAATKARENRLTDTRRQHSSDGRVHGITARGQYLGRGCSGIPAPSRNGRAPGRAAGQCWWRG